MANVVTVLLCMDFTFFQRSFEHLAEASWRLGKTLSHDMELRMYHGVRRFSLTLGHGL